MRRVLLTLLAAASLAGSAPSPLLAQRAQGRESVRAQLRARGVPGELANSVSRIAAEAQRRGLPSATLTDKAIEGWAKGVPAERILLAVRELLGRLSEARQALSDSGATQAAGSEAVLSAGADALARGLTRGEIVAIVRAAGGIESASAALTAAAALAAQGISHADAARAVTEALRSGEPATSLLELPAAARALMASGLAPAEVGRRLLSGEIRGEGGGLLSGRARGRPDILPPEVRERPPRGRRP
jgi:hypothetical protein